MKHLSFSILSCFVLACGFSSASASDCSDSKVENILEKTEKKLAKALSKKKLNKLLKKSKKKLKKSQALLICEIHNRNDLSHSQKIALIEALFQAESELDTLPEENTPPPPLAPIEEPSIEVLYQDLLDSLDMIEEPIETIETAETQQD